MFPKLFSPIKLKGMELKNRVVMPAMGTKFPKGGEVTDQLIAFHEARAKGGGALIFTEVTGVHAPSSPGHYLSLADDKFIPGMKRLADAIHACGAKCGVQLWQGSIAVASQPDMMIIVASDMPVSPEYTIPGASKELIEELIVCYGQAARRAVEAGYDTMEVHMAHNYILHSFLSGGINRRTDEYGGSLENRAKFPLAVIQEIRKNIPADMPLFMRIDAHDDYLEGGLTIEEVIQFCKWAKDAGVDVLDVSRGNIITAGIKYEVPPIDLPQGYNMDNITRIRNEVGLPTMGVGRINDPELAEKLLEEDRCDLIGLGRAQIADPDFVIKAQEGRVDDIVRCIGCNQGCYDANERQDMPHITCLRNPSVGLEIEYTLQPADQPRKILIAGGGMAGMEAAITLKQRGHNPILCEATDKLGGQFILAGLAPRKQEMKAAAEHRGHQAEVQGVEIMLNTEVTPGLIAQIQPDAVINAAGATPIHLNVPGADLPKVHEYVDVLIGKDKLEGSVIVIGGGLVGLETADLLMEKGNQVTIVEMLPEVGADLGTTRKVHVLELLGMAGVQMLTNSTCKAITDEGVIIDTEDGEKTLPCDHVVIAVGAKSKPLPEVEQYCKDKGIEYHAIGDTVKPRRAMDATAEAAKLARAL